MARKNDTTKNIILIGGLGLGLFALVQATKIVKGLGAVVNDQVGEDAIKKKTGANNQTYKACSAIADAVYTAFHEDWDEDEEAAISAMNGAKTAFQVQTVCNIYKMRYGKSLKAEYEKFVHWPDTLSLSSIFKTNMF